MELFGPRVVEDALRSFQFARPGYDGDAGQGFFPAAQVLAWASDKDRVQKPLDVVGEHRRGCLYRPLIDPYEIRVLELKPGIGNDRLYGTLHHCSIEYGLDIPDTPTKLLRGGYTEWTRTKFALTMNLREPVWYTALSYTWGNGVFDRVIECDSFSKAITESLHAALCQFRRPDQSVMLWVDQICINQDDPEEKSGQIPLMSRIYTHALNTIGWLGMPTPETDNVIQLLEEIISTLRFIQSVTCPDDFEGLDLPTADSILWKELWDFLSRPWYKRLWVIQEMTLSSDLWLMCGSHITTFNIVSHACVNLFSCGVSRWLDQTYTANGTDDHCKWIHNISIEKDDIVHGQRGPLFILLRHTRDALCRDPKDKVYGILGISDSSDLEPVKIDYSDNYSVARLYHDVALRKLNQDSYHETINELLPVVDHSNPQSALPSWAPDWSQPRQTVTIGGNKSSYAIYSAAGDNKATFSINDNKDTELNILGTFFDTICHRSRVFTSPDITNRNPLTENKDLLTCIGLCEDLNEYPGSSTVFDAFWHTLVADKDDAGLRRSPDSFAEIFSLLLDESSGKSPTLSGQTYTARQKQPEGKGKLTLAHLGTRTPGRTFQEVRTALYNAMRSRRLGITRRGYLGLFPRETQDGDTVCILKGCHVPFIVRVSNAATVRLVGECYVHGIMRGEAMHTEGFRWETITII
ncbi:heterokaryon incompatibility protein-domain-containing protein [Daldinia vernicosa]|uniref:heterokaryon incompatibility protein-domain-containing protein n=1 Tax=Daldinia vernicosa TaxID=114800 RepID=UPI002007E826|nr:heterokaryon incompatibility protein-domain-containing protein [Daldinia vernicosa]KAI0852756.1 heterokaryon incompatibility protein-domain-containing protein [Daldinia vernicosa]